MTKQYTKEELWKLYEKLPKELQEVIFSGETADHIGNICERHDIKKELIPEVAKKVGHVLMGILPPDKLSAILEKELKIKESIAKKLSQEVDRFIFQPVKPALYQLYDENETISEKEKYNEEGEKETLEESSVRRGKDIYREPIE